MDGEDGAALDAAQFVTELDAVFSRKVGTDFFQSERVSASVRIVTFGELLALLGDFNLVDEPLDFGLRVSVSFEDECHILVALFSFDILEGLLDFRLAADLQVGAVLFGSVGVCDDARVLARVAALDSADGQTVDRSVLFHRDGLSIVNQLLAILDPVGTNNRFLLNCITQRRPITDD